MNLPLISFPPILDTSSNDIIKDFFNPALGASVRYDRGVGFFSAAWLRLASLGMAEFAANSGRAMVADGILDFKLALPRNKLDQEVS